MDISIVNLMEYYLSVIEIIHEINQQDRADHLRNSYARMSMIQVKIKLRFIVNTLIYLIFYLIVIRLKFIVFLLADPKEIRLLIGQKS